MTFTDTSPKKIIQTAKKREKMFYIIYHHPCTATSIAKTGTLTTPSADEGVEQQEFSFIVGRNAKWYSHFRRQFGGFLQN